MTANVFVVPVFFLVYCETLETAEVPLALLKQTFGGPDRDRRVYRKLVKKPLLGTWFVSSSAPASSVPSMASESATGSHGVEFMNIKTDESKSNDEYLGAKNSPLASSGLFKNCPEAKETEKPVSAGTISD